MKILMLVNWKVEYTSCTPKDKQPPDYVADGEKYWFFRYFPDAIQADVIDIRSFSALEHFEKISCGSTFGRHFGYCRGLKIMMWFFPMECRAVLYCVY